MSGSCRTLNRGMCDLLHEVHLHINVEEAQPRNTNQRNGQLIKQHIVKSASREIFWQIECQGFLEFLRFKNFIRICLLVS